MRTKLLSYLTAGLPATIAIIILVLFSSAGKTKDDKGAASVEAQCCSGYSMSTSNLKKFMIDSLHSIQFEGGVYSKADLLDAINNLSPQDDSVYLVNILANCNVQHGTDLALTSRHTNGVQYVRARTLCHPCPKPCCRVSACVAKIKRNCIKYIAYPAASNALNRTDVSSLQDNE